LRECLDDARDSIGRGEELYSRLESALTKAYEQDGTLISAETFQRAIAILELLPPDIPVPEIVVENDAELGLDWDEGVGQVLSLTVRETPFVGFAAMFGLEPLYGRVAVVSEIPKILEFLLRRLYQAPPRR
jgi:hypothetical protein